MSNRTFAILIGLAWFFGIYATLNAIYVELDLHKASYAYLGTAVWMIFLMLFIRKVERGIKNWINFLVITFYIFAIILSLITFYASPTDKLDFLAGAIFFLSGSLALGGSFFLKIEKEIKEEQLGVIHKLFRYILLLLFVSAFLFPLTRLIQSGSSHLTKMSKAELTEEMLHALPSLNKDLPKMLDNITQLEKISFEDMKFTYHYRLIDSNETVDFILSLKKSIMQTACQEGFTAMLIENSVSMVYSYGFNNQDKSVEITVDKCSKDDYQTMTKGRREQ